VPQDEADRVAAERAASRGRQGKLAHGAARTSQREELDALRERAEVAIKRFLDQKAAEDYEGIEQVEAYVPNRGLARLFGKQHLSKLGGYRLLSTFMLPERIPRPIYVLSNERFLVGRSSHSSAEFASLVEKHEGLSTTRGHYPRMEPWTLEVFRALVSYLEAHSDREV